MMRGLFWWIQVPRHVILLSPFKWNMLWRTHLPSAKGCIWRQTNLSVTISMSFSELLTYCKNVMPKVAQNAWWALCYGKFFFKKNGRWKKKHFKLVAINHCRKWRKQFFVVWSLKLKLILSTRKLNDFLSSTICFVKMVQEGSNL